MVKDSGESVSPATVKALLRVARLVRMIASEPSVSRVMVNERPSMEERPRWGWLGVFDLCRLKIQFVKETLDTYMVTNIFLTTRSQRGICSVPSMVKAAV